MTLLFSILRFAHIIAGILWSGGALAFSFFVGPSLSATGDAGKEFAAYLMGKSRFSTYMMVTGLITVLAGSILYGIDSSWFRFGWMQTPTGIGFGLGAAAGIVAFIYGAMLGNTNVTLAALSAQIQGQPSAGQMSAMQALLKRQSTVSQWHMIFMLITIVLMASARLFG
ncbi:hypothetical protein MASR2M66_01150 [Chloroflexota bacterium]